MENEEKSTGMRIGPWQIATVVLGILLIISIVTGGFSGGAGGGSKADQDEISKKVSDFVNTYMMRGQAKAELKGIQEEAGLYNITFGIQGREVNAYTTLDGKLFFPQGIDLDQMQAQAPSQPPQQQEAAEIPKTDKPEVKLFTMSYCPYGDQAEKGIMPVVELLGDSVEIRPHYIVSKNPPPGRDRDCLETGGNKYCSLHGLQELNQDIREMCVYKYQKDKYWDFIEKVNMPNCNSRNADTCWEPIGKEVGLDVAKIKKCQKSEAAELLDQEIELTKKFAVSGSPTLIINEVKYRGGRAPEDFKQAICDAFTEGNTPEKCTVALGKEGGKAAGKCD